MTLTRVTLDKISSVAKNADINHDVYLSDEVVAEEGYVVAVKILTDKAVYNQLENVEGRMTRLKPGDLIAGVLGNRRALRGYAGSVPESLKVGDELQVLNLGGVVGICTSYAPDVGKPFSALVMGAVLHFPYLGKRLGVPANIRRDTVKRNKKIKNSAPVIAVMGTCMDAGKTVAACEIIHGLTRRGLSVAAGKLTGVALQRDVLGMLDHGAVKALSFIDAGFATTNTETAPIAARWILNELNQERPDAVVLEMGDGILGDYGVQAILSEEDLKNQISTVVLCATDQVGAWGGTRLLQSSFDLDCDVLTGPVTDNEVGRDYIKNVLKVAGANALTEPENLLELVFKKVTRNE